jgi:hypothetical protein
VSDDLDQITTLTAKASALADREVRQAAEDLARSLNRLVLAGAVTDIDNAVLGSDDANVIQVAWSVINRLRHLDVVWDQTEFAWVVREY